MWFKQLTFYRTDVSKMPAVAEFCEALQQIPFNHCSGLEWYRQGWVPPAAHVADPMLAVRHALCLCLKKEDKVLPAAVIKDVLDNKITLIEEQESRKVGKKEKQELKEQVTDDLLPRAFVRSSCLNALINCERNWLMLNTATSSKSEAFLSALREAVPGFYTALPRTVYSPSTVMTEWLLSGEIVGPFELDSDCELKAPGEGGATVRCSHQDLTAEEVQQHLKNGKVATKLGLIWREKVRFILTEELQLKRLQFLEGLQEEAEQAGDDMSLLTEATFLLMSEELGLLIDELVDCLGGLHQ